MTIEATRPARRSYAAAQAELEPPRPPLTSAQGAELVALFKLLGDETRLRLLDLLRGADELRVGDLARELGMSSQAVSNQLQRLRDRDVVAARRDGNSIYYRIIDPCVTEMLESAFCLVEEARLEPSDAG